MQIPKMNSEQEQMPTEFETENLESLDDFLRELEEKEKDLNMSDEMVIEIDEFDINDESISEEIQEKLSAHIGISPENSSAAIHISTSDAGEIRLLKDKISELENINGDLINTLAHHRKDFENHRQRTERERIETFSSQIGNLATQLLPVLDNLDRALDMEKNIAEGKFSDSQQFFDGIVLVNQQLNETLAEMGVQPIRSVGEQFNPEIHEAVATGESKDFPPNTVSEELLRGYRIGDKVIRAAMVKVVVENGK